MRHLTAIGAWLAAAALATGLTAVQVGSEHRAFTPALIATIGAGGVGLLLLFVANAASLAGRVQQRFRLHAGPKSLDGIWLSRYEYRRQAESAHYVVLQESRGRVRGRSLRHPSGSVVELDLKRTGDSVLTGEWVEQTSPTGEFGGQTFHGSLHLLIDNFRDRLTGKWTGFGTKADVVNHGPWTFTRVSDRTGWRERRRWRDRDPT